MKVTVKYFTTLREITDKREEEIKFSSDLTVGELLERLSKKHGRRFMDYVYDKGGNVQSYLQFLVNGRSVTTLEGFKTKLKEGDRVAIIPPVCGV